LQSKPPGIFLKRKLRKYLPATANLLVVADVTRETEQEKKKDKQNGK